MHCLVCSFSEMVTYVRCRDRLLEAHWDVDLFQWLMHQNDQKNGGPLVQAWYKKFLAFLACSASVQGVLHPCRCEHSDNVLEIQFPTVVRFISRDMGIQRFLKNTERDRMFMLIRHTTSNASLYIRMKIFQPRQSDSLFVLIFRL